MLTKLAIDDQKLNADQLKEAFQDFSDLLSGNQTIMLHSSHPLSTVMTLMICYKRQLSLFLCHSFFSESTVAELVETHKPELLVSVDKDGKCQLKPFSDAAASDSGSLYIFTTGTTGTPKCVKHSWDSISYASRHVSKRFHHRRWLMAYSFTGYAGLQVFFSAFKSGGELVFTTQPEFANFAHSIVTHGVEIISATPTFWRLLINNWPRSLEIPILEQATLGGEIITQDTLDLITKFFKPKGLTHIYASSEAGSAIAVSDRCAGFPASYLDPTRAIKLRIKDGILEILSPSKMEGYINHTSNITDDGWIHTGDLVEQIGDRIFFLGRNDSQINIGGSKVRPEEVEEVLNRHEGIKDSVVYQKKNPIVGSILAADVVLEYPSSCDIRQIKEFASKFMPAYKVPQHIRFIDSIRISENGKKFRQ